MRKRSIHFSDEWDSELKELVDLLGLTKTYGAESRALRFSTTLAVKYIRWFEKSTPLMNSEELGKLFTSVAGLRLAKEKATKLKLEKEKLEKVTPKKIIPL